MTSEAAPPSPPVAAGTGTSLTGAPRDILAAADTFFVASANPDGGLDVSHRGGPPGFVTILDDATLSIPDYRGNGMFNTLGNLAIHPRAGILLLDFNGRRVLQMTGTAQIHWERPSDASPSAETARRWTFALERWLLRTLPLRMEFTLLEYSPFNPR